MKVVLAPDSFKESMTAAEATDAMARGVQQVYPDAECIAKPLADGGEGTLAVLSAGLSAEVMGVDTQDCLGRPIRAPLALTRSGTAVIEAATVIGLAQLRPEERRIDRASSFGLAALVRAALDAGSTRIIVGLGGTATCDGGVGLLVGLGARLQDANGSSLPPNPVGLAQLAAVDLDGLDPRASACEIVAASDVTNPLLGANGAAAVFAPQKGASVEQVPWLEAGLTRWAEALAAAGAGELGERSGAGAAGGLGAALLALGAAMRSGVDLVAEAIGLAAAIDGADLVLTGEGSLDAQTASGKAPLGVLRIAAGRGVPVLAFGGRVRDRDRLERLGFAALISLSDDSDAAPTANDLALGAQRLEQAVSVVLARRRDSGD